MNEQMIVTGAAGGMGRACARLLGTSRPMVLTDIAQEPLEALAAELSQDGYTVSGTFPGDLSQDENLKELMGALGDNPCLLIHTAGLSPTQAPWQQIMQANLIATEKLLRAYETRLVHGSVAIVVASSAGHLALPPTFDETLANPLAPDFMEKIGAGIDQMVGENPKMKAAMTYAFSKRAVIAACERRAKAWGDKGARIVTISPGTILTPMGRRELDSDPMVRMVTEAAPAGRPGSPMDIAFAARFLASPEAGFITGCDLRVDGGSVGSQR